MKAPDQSENREEKALQALVSAALHARGDEVSMDEIQPYLAEEVTLSAEDEAALKRRGSKFLIRPAAVPATSQAETADVEAFMALHRKQPEKGFSAKTEEEIRRKREELLAQLQKKKGTS
jgi:hypothetical protein